jgi:hypothetical protein
VLRRIGAVRAALLPALLLCTSLALVAGTSLALHHPLWPSAVTVVFAGWVALTFWRPGLWVLVLPAALPWMNFSPWTGWIVFEEFDLLLLGALAGGYARWAHDASPAGAMWRLPTGAWRTALALLFGALSVVSLYRGMADAGFGVGWYDGYTDALNSLRVFKPLAYALLLWPLLQRQLQGSTPFFLRRLSRGVLVGLSVVCVAVLWERAAFPGLWDFSEPYRTVALFWEMHVGGAAIDADLALTLPFVAWALWAAKSPAQWLGAAAVALLAFYACLTTFSRGLYLAVAGPMLLLGLWLQTRGVGFDARASLRQSVAYATLAAAAGAALHLAHAAYGTAGAVGVSLGFLLMLAVLVQRLGGWRRAAGTGLALLLVLQAVAVFGTGSFMAARVNASERDFGGRLQHWRNGLGLLQSPADWLFGIGLGRLPASYARFVPEREFSGAAQWIELPPGLTAVRLSGPRTQSELGGLFALTQRVPLPPEAAYWVEFDARVLAPADVLLSVCEKHLLYEGRCQSARLRLRPADASWQHHRLPLSGPLLGDEGVPRLRVFALSILTAGAEIEFNKLRLTGAGPDNLLRNGDFSRAGAHWLPGAQSYFVPWHIDNLYLELLIERGLAGLALFLALAGWALWSLLVGPGRREPIAPFLAASLCGGLLVGLVSSVMDVPRVAWLFWLLLLLAFGLGRTRGATSAGDRTSTGREHR